MTIIYKTSGDDYLCFQCAEEATNYDLVDGWILVEARMLEIFGPTNGDVYWCAGCGCTITSKWHLFLDDDAGKPGIASFRNPPEGDGKTWKVAHSSAKAIAIIKEMGVPAHISFDFDLGMKEDGSKDTAIEVINYLSWNHYDAEIEYEVHSLNPEGVKQIVSKMESWKKSKTL